MLNMAVDRPMPRASARTAASVWPGVFASTRKPKRRSRSSWVMSGVPPPLLRGGPGKVTGARLLGDRRLLRLQGAPGVLALVELGQGRHAAAGGVDLPAPEERPLQVGAVGLEHAEDQPVHAVQDAELEDVGP